MKLHELYESISPEDRKSLDDIRKVKPKKAQNMERLMLQYNVTLDAAEKLQDLEPEDAKKLIKKWHDEHREKEKEQQKIVRQKKKELRKKEPKQKTEYPMPKMPGIIGQLQKAYNKGASWADQYTKPPK